MLPPQAGLLTNGMTVIASELPPVPALVKGKVSWTNGGFSV